MRVLVAGSGEWTNDGSIRRELSKLATDTTIICGDFPGADALAAQIARELGQNVEAFKKEPEDYHRYGRGARKALNERMLASGVDQVLAFHANIEKSKGTKHLVELARQKGVTVQVFAD